MDVIYDAFEVELDEKLFNVSVSFKLSDEGPVALQLELISELHDSDHPLIFTKFDIAQIRFDIADSIERKYYTGQYVFPQYA